MKIHTTITLVVLLMVSMYAQAQRDGGQTFSGAKLTAPPTVDFGTPTPLFATSILSPGVNTFRPHYAVSPDGRSFVLQSPVGQANASPITVILNWKPNK